MRVLIVHPGPEFSVSDVYDGWNKALKKLGCEVAGYNTNDRLLFYGKALIDTGTTDEHGLPIVRQALNEEQAVWAAVQGLAGACYTFWPDVVLFISGFFLTQGVLDVMGHRGHKLAMLMTESPYQDEEQLQRAQFMDLVLLNDPVNIDRYREVAPTEYMPHAYDPDRHHPRRGPRDEDLASDFAFVGTAFKSRAQFFSKMHFGLAQVKFGGGAWDKLDGEHRHLLKYLIHDAEKCLDNNETVRLYQNTKMSINFYRRESEEAHRGEGWAMGPREVELAACGVPFLRDPRGENEQVLPMLPAYESPEEASHLLRWWLAHDKERERAAAMAREAVADRTFDNHAAKLLRMLDN